MKRYLVFDAKCSTCSNLARSIEDAVKDKLEAINIYDSKAITLLDQAYPEGWEHAPYLVKVDEGRVRVRKGLAMMVQLGWLMGPRQAWHIWRLVRQTGAALPTTPARRQFLKLSLGLGFVATMGSLRWLTPVAFACVPCGTCGENCVVDKYCYMNAHVCGDPTEVDHARKSDCYDNRSGEYCYSIIEWTCDISCI